MSAEEFKSQGNEAFSAKQYDKAIDLFTKAIELDPSNHVLYSNRSACYASLKQYDKALEDANKTIELKNTWAKGYSRKGAALHGLGKLEEARETYQEGLKHEQNNAQLKKALEEVESALADDFPVGKIFPDDVLVKIALNPQLRPYLDQPDFIDKVKAIQADPKQLNTHLQDERIKNVFMYILTGGVSPSGPQEQPQPQQPQQPQQSQQPEESPESQTEPTEKSEEQLKKEESNKEKELGNAAYKKREFEEALKHYNKAWELDSTNASILTNKAAVLFEQEKYEDCIKVCEEAIEVGREHRADFKLIARAYGRIGNAYSKLDKLDEAIKYYQKSLTEHRTPDTLKKLNDTQKLKIKKEKEAYYNPELSDKAREEGNELFKKNDFANAVAKYSEAIKRNENDPRAYSNRAACYTKLMAYLEALKDCETCISLDPTFVKAYIRKAAVEFLKKEYTKCLETCETALSHDKNGQHAAEISKQMEKCREAMWQSNNASGSQESTEETLRKAASDPEIVRILQDPVMQQILQQSQEDPRAFREHLKNPTVSANIHKLINAGVLRTA
ncbi:putative heat shock protein 70-interacting protein [Glomus cerebriforme]|uniref:Putative heat shock protein 70-interacting protein n=1 Tax=Glomus cerebriforme TaxID=658196 RepID=A0A397S781_9GLOM|nr:putative heat shock protein 70-interacting protein [Glomus cerebriforme]